MDQVEYAKHIIRKTVNEWQKTLPGYIYELRWWVQYLSVFGEFFEEAIVILQAQIDTWEKEVAL
jgi:hypothetical protein